MFGAELGRVVHVGVARIDEAGAGLDAGGTLWSLLSTFQSYLSTATLSRTTLNLYVVFAICEILTELRVDMVQAPIDR